MHRTHGCRRTAELLSQEREHALRLTERAALRLHLWMCVGCRRYARQLDLLGQAAARWRQGSGDASSERSGNTE